VLRAAKSSDQKPQYDRAEKCEGPGHALPGGVALVKSEDEVANDGRKAGSRKQQNAEKNTHSSDAKKQTRTDQHKSSS
jgi:hypothetical protein